MNNRLRDRAAGVIGLLLVVTACGQSADPGRIAPATAEGVDTTASPGTAVSTTTTSVDSDASPIAEPAVTVPPTTLPAPPPVPDLARVEAVLVALVFDGQDVAEARPGAVPGAGEIEILGDVDVYTFDALAGQAFVLEQLGGCEIEGGDSLSVAIRGAGVSTRTVLQDGDCRSITRVEIEDPTTIEITVDSAGNDATGTYAFRVVEVTDDPVVELVSGDVVFPNDPTGAGWIEGFGHQDLYQFEATEDRPFVIRQLGSCAFEGFDDSVSMRVRGQGITRTVPFLDGDCSSVTRFEPETSGPVDIVVRNAGDDVYGIYAFQIYELVTNDVEADAAADSLGAETSDATTTITVSETLLFDFGSAELRREADETLAQLAELLGFRAVGPIAVIGHTDSVGSVESNQRLSEDRASAVVQRLIEFGVAGDILVAEGRGELEPIAPNVGSDGSDNPDGRALNRRVEVVFER